MFLRNNPVAMIFVETTSVDRARQLFEKVIGLPVIENQFHPPHHHHGIIKYDAGNIILALNLARSAETRAGSREGILTTIAVRHARRAMRNAIEYGLGTETSAATMIDGDGHRFEFIEGVPGQRGSSIVEIAYAGGKPSQMREFYADRLGLEHAERRAESYRAGKILLSIEASQPDSHVPMRHDGYLTVIHAPDIRKTAAAFSAAGIPLLGEVRFTRIGGTVRFADPAGHQFCLYEPAPDCFDWGSGPKLAELVDRPQMGEAPA